VTNANKIALVGLRASGKTSVGRELARRLGCAFVDLDEETAHAFQKSKTSKHTARSTVGEVLTALGESAFRDLESHTLERVLSGPHALVLATGGGVVERETNLDVLARQSIVVWLEVPVPELQRRMRADPTPRPPLFGRDAIDEVPEVAHRRDAVYARIARLTVGGWPGSPSEVAERISFRLAEAGLTPGSSGIHHDS
jgi:shikimate kinase